MPCKAPVDLIEISDDEGQDDVDRKSKTNKLYSSEENGTILIDSEDDEDTSQPPQNPETRMHQHKAPPSKAKQKRPLSNSRTEVHSLPSGSRVLKDVQSVTRDIKKPNL
jgi:hypothetical protein